MALVISNIRFLPGLVPVVAEVLARGGSPVVVVAGRSRDLVSARGQLLRSTGVPHSDVVRASVRTPPRAVVSLRLVAAVLMYWALGEYDTKYERRALRFLAEGNRALAFLLSRGRRLRLRGKWIATILRALRFIDRRLVVARAVRRQLRALGPSAILAIPANIPRFGAKSDVAPDFLREATRLGIPTFSVAATWDSFTSKGTFTVAPRHVLCWNDFQREAAVVRHGLDPARVHITGSPRFGHELARGRSLLASLGSLTPVDAPEPPPSGFVVWVVSSGGITSAEDERQHISGLVDALSRSSSTSDVEVLVRPYPDRSEPLGRLTAPRTAIWPSVSSGDHDDRLGTMLWTLRHAVCVIGVNTSAFLDANLWGIPCLALHRVDNDAAHRPSHHLGAIIAAGGAIPVDDAGKAADIIAGMERPPSGGWSAERLRPSPFAERALLGAGSPHSPSGRVARLLLA